MAIGILITIEPGPVDSEYDRWRLYRSTTQSGTFSLIGATAGQLLTAPSFFDVNGTADSWYKTTYWENSDQVESTQTDAFQPQNEKYTTVREVQRFMRLPTVTDSTTPSIEEISNLIKTMQDDIDHQTGHAWRKRFSGTHSGSEQTSRFEYYDLDNYFEFHTGRPVYLKHRFIYTMDSTEGDALGVWDGNAYVNFLSTKTEAREDDFWFDYDRGILFLSQRWGITKALGVQIKYRYGERFLNNIVQKICVRMVAKELLYGENRSPFIPGGENSAISQSVKLDKWEKEIEAGLSRVREFQIMGMAR